MGTSVLLPLDERINGAVVDSPDVIYKLSKLGVPSDNLIEIVTELPAANDIDIILGYVKRWVEIQHYFKCDLRIYAWSHTVEVEKYVLGCVQHMKHISVTPLPTYLKEIKRYA